MRPGRLVRSSRLSSFQILFRIKRQLDQPLEQLVRRQPGEIAHDQLLGKQAGNVAELQGLVARGKDEIPMTAVDDDEILFGVEARTPKFAGRAAKGIAGDSGTSG